MATMRPLLNALLYFPSRVLAQTPAHAGLEFRDVWCATDDGERLHAWWIARRAPALGHVLLCHGNAGNVGDRILHADLLTRAGFDVLLFDYRGYGRSSGAPSERGTYRDARAARACLLRQEGVDAARRGVPRRVARRRGRARARARPPARSARAAVGV